MAVASIKSTRNGDPATSLVNASREDLLDGDVITLESIGAGATSHSWSILFSPDGSSVGLTSTNTAVTQFAVDKEGAYLIRLIVDAGLSTESSQHVRLRALTKFGGLQLVAAGERRDEEAIIPTDIGIYGWAYEQNGNIRKILDFLKPLVQSGRVVHVDSGSDHYGDFASIQDAIDFCVLEGASESSPFVVLVREGMYNEVLTLKPFVHVISTQHKNTDEVPDLQAKPKLSPRVVVKSNLTHTAELVSPTETAVVVGVHFFNDTVTSNPMIAVSGEGVLQTNACTFESVPTDPSQGALVDLQGGRFVGLDCRFRMDEGGDVGNFAFLQSGEDTTSMFVDCSFSAPSCLAINPSQHNVGGVINVLRNCTVKGVQYGLATNGTSTVISSTLKGASENLSINWLGSSYGVSNSGNSEQTILFSEIEGDIYWNKDNTSHNNVLKVGAVVFQTLNESGTGSAISVEAMANALTISFDNTLSALTSTNVQEALIELEGLVTGGAGTAINIGAGEGIFKQKTGLDLELRSLIGTSGVTVALSGSGDELEIGYSGVAITNRIDEGDSSVIVTDSGVNGVIDFYTENTHQWRIDGVGTLVNVGGGELLAGLVTLNKNLFNTSAGAAGERELLWNDTDGTLDLGLKGGNVTLQVGQETVFRCINSTASTINNGQAVYIRGANGASGKLEVALATNDNPTAHTAVGLATEDIPAGGEGFITTYGLVRDIDTSGLAGSEGSVVYLGTSGNLTSTKPNVPDHDIEIGFLVRKNVGSGQIFVRVREIHLTNWQEDTSQHLLPLSTSTQNIGSPTNKVNVLYTDYIGDNSNRVVEAWVDQLWVNNTNTIHFFDPTDNTVDIHLKVDKTGDIPLLNVGNTICAGLPDFNGDGYYTNSLGQPVFVQEAADGKTPLVWDILNGNHLWVESLNGQNDVPVKILSLDGKTIPLFDIQITGTNDVPLTENGNSLVGGDGNDWLCIYSATEKTFKPVTLNSLQIGSDNMAGIPTALSAFTNDVGFLTEVGDVDFNDLLNKPTNLSDFVNDTFFGDEIHFSVSPDASGQVLVYNNDTSSFVPTAQQNLVVDYQNLANKPILFSGDYNDLLNKPLLFDGSYDSLTNKPTLFSGNYNDLFGKPTLFSGSYIDLTNKPTLFDGNYNTLSNKPVIPSHINDLTMPSGGLDGYLLAQEGTDVKFVAPSEAHVDDVYAHTMLAQGNAAKPVTAQFGWLYLVELLTENIEINLPDASDVDKFRTITIKLVARTGEYSLTITPLTGQQIDKNNNIVWASNSFLMKSVTLYSDGSNWWII